MTTRSAFAPAGLAISLAGCATVLAPAAFDANRPELQPEVFFAGATTSTGVLETASGAPSRQFHVAGTGEMTADGALRLSQSIVFGDDAPQRRTWLLRRLDAIITPAP